MEIFKQILTPALIFIGLGALMGVLLAVATKVFRVEKNEKAEEILTCLPGANCGGCGFTGCAALAEAIAAGEAKVSSCTVGGDEAAAKIAAIMGVEAEKSVRMRAQVMCSGTHTTSLKKYKYVGINDCVAASKLGGGDKKCPNGCIGLGTCAANCPFGAIHVENGIAVVDHSKCRGCGVCEASCPKGAIRLIPFDSNVWVGCISHDKGKDIRSYCELGCIACKMCEKACPTGAITVNENVARIDYEKCVNCGACAEKCPRGIIHTAETQKAFIESISAEKSEE